MTETKTNNSSKTNSDINALAANVQSAVQDATRDAVARVQKVGGQALSTATKKASKMSTSAKVAVGVGAAVAGIAAIRLATTRLRKGQASVYHLEPTEDGWRLRLDSAERASALFETKQDGLEAARELVAERAPSELVVHLADGSEQTRHRYEAS